MCKIISQGSGYRNWFRMRKLKATHYLQWCREISSTFSMKQCLPAISFLHPHSVNGSSIFILIYFPFSTGPGSELSTSFFFLDSLSHNSLFYSENTHKAACFWNGRMKGTYFGWNGSRRKPCQMPFKSCNTCWLKLAAYTAQGKNLFFSFKLWLEKSISMNQFISYWLASLISSSNGCNRKYKAAL